MSVATEDRSTSLTDEWESRSGRWALVVFVVYLVVAGGLILFVIADDQWFFWDEWDFLADREATDLGDLWRPHNEHLQPLPILVYRALFEVFGLNTYLPYQLAVVVLHLTGAFLLRVIMRRVGVGPWIATISAATIVLFGTGHENIVSGFQIGFLGSFVLGLSHLLLADHDGPPDRRDWIGLVVGLAGVLCSGIGVTMVAVVGLAVLIRRGWKPALLHTAPIGVLYGLWYVIERPAENTNPLGAGPLTIAEEVVRFVQVGVAATFSAMGQLPGVGLVLALLLIGGLVLAWSSLDRATLRVVASMPAALMAGAVLMLVITGYGRWNLGNEFARSSRYLYLVMAMILPALAVAADAVCRRWRWTTPLVILALVVGVPGNIADFKILELGPTYAESQRQLFATVLASPYAERVPGWVEVEPILMEGVTVGWLLRSEAEGSLPPLGDPSPELMATMPVRLGVPALEEPVPEDADCQELTAPIEITVNKGDVIGIDGGLVAVTQLDEDGQPVSMPLTYNSAFTGRHVLAVQLDDLRLRIGPANPKEPAEVCL